MCTKDFKMRCWQMLALCIAGLVIFIVAPEWLVAVGTVAFFVILFMFIDAVFIFTSDPADEASLSAPELPRPNK